MQLPLRQKIALGLTVIIGVFIVFACNVEIIEPETLKWVIIFYCLLAAYQCLKNKQSLFFLFLHFVLKKIVSLHFKIFLM